MGDDKTAALAAVLRRARVLPVLRVADAEAALGVVGRLADAGLPAVELTATTAGWANALAETRRRWPGLLAGVGTVTTARAASEAAGLGAGFLVSPCPAPEARAAAAEAGIPFIEGGFTPAEVASAASRGIAKLFPAHVGGTQYLSSLLSVLPGALVIPTGGIKLTDAADWLRAGALAVGVGRALLDCDVTVSLAALSADSATPG
jgi:2-dehydro-3-deoxyphosphogluconate aldolase / (4S)-4-hydroxy-2-oxoglutarate aldolase